MGCDIHMSIERRTNLGTWDIAPDAPTYGGRNYSLFAMLAGVRNGSGFAGIDIGNPVVPIAEPRGVPEDASEEYAAEVESWDIDGHSHTWFTLAELLNVDWSGNKITHRAWARRRKDAPIRTGETHDEFARRLESFANTYGELPPAQYWHYETCGDSSEGQGPSGWRTIEWTESWATAAGSGWLTVLLSLYRLGNPEATRLTMFFDN